MGTGSEFVKKIRPAGAALFLILFVLFMITCFTLKIAPVKGYNRPESREYYAENPEALAAELNEHLLPQLECSGWECSVNSEGLVEISAPEAELEQLKHDVTYYFGESCLVFTGKEGL